MFHFLDPTTWYHRGTWEHAEWFIALLCPGLRLRAVPKLGLSSVCGYYEHTGWQDRQTRKRVSLLYLHAWDYGFVQPSALQH